MSAISWFFLGASTGAAATAIARPLLGATRGALRRGPSLLIVGALGAITFAAAATAMLLVISSRRASSQNPHPTLSSGPAATMPNVQRAAPMEVAAAGLAARLKRQGGTPADWNLLAESYDFLGRPQDAERAREHAANEAARESLKFPTPASAAGTRAAVAR